MRSDVDIACLDACVLAGALKRNLLLSFADVGLFAPVWTRKILSETEYAIARILAGRGMAEAQHIARIQVERIENAFPDATHACVPIVIPNLPDPDDQHVVAAAIAANASIIVTDNVSDFPRKVMKRYDITIFTADEFLAILASLDIDRALKAFESMRQRFLRPELSQQDLFERMKTTGLKKTVRTFSAIKTM